MILLIIATYIMLSVTILYIDNILNLNTGSVYSKIRYIYISIGTIFFMAGITFILSQYYNIMWSGIRDYCVHRGLGATKHNINCLIIIQVAFLIIISIPVGLFVGYLLTSWLVCLIREFTFNQTMADWLSSYHSLFLISGFTCLLIISVGIYLGRGIRKMSITNILLDYSFIGKEE